MKYFTWNRNSGYVLVIPCANGTSVIVSDKVFATKRGALAFGNRIDKRCTHPVTGKLWNRDLPWFTVDIDTGERTDHFHTEEIGNIYTSRS